MQTVSIFEPSSKLEAAIEELWPFGYYHLLSGNTTLLDCTQYVIEPSGRCCVTLNSEFIKVSLLIQPGHYEKIRKWTE